MSWDILIKNCKGLVQVREQTPDALRGTEMAHLPILSNSYLAIQDSRIVAYGEMSDLPTTVAKESIDASDRFVFPSYVDSHTHLVFAASREDEFVMKIKGATYAEIAAKGGGILNSAKKLQQLSEEELYDKKC